jgi:branched-chain amino acid transport system ATP-binding protein
MAVTRQGAPLLEVRSVRKAFGSLVAVDDVSFTVAEGDILGIAGPNGAGKTTLFNLISGIPFAADRGQIVFQGTRIERLAPHAIYRLGLARTFQREASFAKLTVEQNVQLGASFGGRLHGVADRARAVAEALELFELTSQRYDLAETLPVYATKRVMLASAVVSRPKLLMLDEPASGLSAVELADVQRLVLRLRDQGTSIIIIEHILPLLFGISGRVMVMDFGRKLVEGSPAAIARDERVIEAYLGGAGEAAFRATIG